MRNKIPTNLVGMKNNVLAQKNYWTLQSYDKLIRKFLDFVFSLLEFGQTNFLSYSAYSIDVNSLEHPINLYDYSDTSIVMQGQVLKNNQKLFLVLKNYLRNYPNISIIISTWKGEDSKHLGKLFKKLAEWERDRVTIVLNNMPENSGIANVNLQLISTRAALAIVQQQNRKFVLKTRTDQGLLKHDAIRILRDHWKTYNDEKDSVKKIVIGSRNTFLFRPYSFSDMMQFGTVDLLVKFWETDLDKRNKDQFSFEQGASAIQWSLKNVAEVYLVREYLKRINANVDLNFEAHIRALANFFIVVDSEALGFLWTKYGYNTSPWKKNGFLYPTYEVSHSDWLHGDVFLQNSAILQKYCELQWK